MSAATWEARSLTLRAEREREAERQRACVRSRLFPRNGRTEVELTAILVARVGSEWSSGVGRILRDLEEREEAHQRDGQWFLGAGERVAANTTPAPASQSGSPSSIVLEVAAQRPWWFRAELAAACRGRGLGAQNAERAISDLVRAEVLEVEARGLRVRSAETAGAEPVAGEGAQAPTPGLTGSRSLPGEVLPHPRAVASTESGGTEPADAVEQAVELHAQDNTVAEPAPATQAGAEPATEEPGGRAGNEQGEPGPAPSGPSTWRARREALGWSQAELARRAGELLGRPKDSVVADLSMAERGKRAPSRALAEGVERVLAHGMPASSATSEPKVAEPAPAPNEPRLRLPYADVARRMAEIVRRHPDGIAPAAITAELPKGQRVNQDVQRRALRTARELGLVEARGATLQRKYFPVAKAVPAGAEAGPSTESEFSAAASADPAAGLDEEIAELGRRAADLVAARAHGREVPSWPNHQPSAPIPAAEPSAPEGSVARPTDVAAQPGSGESGGEASPGASASQAGPPPGREPETVGASPAPVPGNPHASLPAEGAQPPAVGSPGDHRQGGVSGVQVGPWQDFGFWARRKFVGEDDDAALVRDLLPRAWQAWARPFDLKLAGSGEADSMQAVKAAADAWLLAHGVEVPDPVVVPEPWVDPDPAASACYGRPPLEEQVSQLVATLEEVENERDALRAQLSEIERASYDPDRIVAALAALDDEDVLAERWEERYREACARVAELEVALARATAPTTEAFDAAVSARERVAQLEDDLADYRADLLVAQGELALVDQVLGGLLADIEIEDRRVRLGILLERVRRMT